MDLLEKISLSLPCPRCGERYEVPLRNVLASQVEMHEGCPVAMPEDCPQSYWSTLAGQEDIGALERAWERVAARAHAGGGRLVIHAGSEDDG